MKNLIFLFTAVLLIIAGCRKDSDTVDTNIIFPEPGVFVETTIGGKVTSEAGNPVIGANVYLGSETAKTDNNGFFLFSNITVPENNAYIRVEHPSYFHGSRTIKVSAATRNKVAIQLLSNQPTKFVDAGSGGIADYGDYSVKLPANGIITSIGTVYSGQVGVAAKWLDPTSDNFGIQMPGQLAGIRTDGSFTGMISKGMLAVELSDANGARLQIREGYEASIKIKVDNALLDDAPAEIPLWHFDEKSGLWVEEGSAELKNGFYEGNVKHFSFWNCDIPVEAVYLTVKVQDPNGNPLSNCMVVLSVVPAGDSRSGYTDSTGTVYGLVPKNTQMEARVYMSTNICPLPFIQQIIGQFSQNDMITITIDTSISFGYTYTLSGDLIDCSGQPVSNGYVRIPEFNQEVIVDNLGHFEITQYSCTPINTATVTGYDVQSVQASGTQSVNLVTGSNSAGTLTACIGLNSFITYSFGGNDLLFTPASFETFLDTINTNIFTNLIASSSNLNSAISFSFSQEITGPGIYSIDGFTAYGVMNGQEFYHGCLSQDCANISVNILTYTGVGGTITGNFSGTIPSVFPVGTASISGTFSGTVQ